MTQNQNAQYSKQDTIARADTALKRMLATPHKPHKPIGKRKRSAKLAKAQRFLKKSAAQP